MSRQPLLFIERSTGLSGSSISLCHILAHLDRSRYEPCAAFSRPEQRAYIERRVSPPFAAGTITPGHELSSRRAGRRLLRLAAACRAERVGRAVLSLGDLASVEAPYLARLYRFARRHGVVGIHQNNGFDAAAVVLARLLGVPLVAYQRGEEWSSLLARHLAGWVDLYLANSRATKANLTGLGVPAEKVVVLYPPIELPGIVPEAEAAALRQQFGLAASQPCFGILGKLVPWKGHAVFLRAARRVIDAIPDARAFVIGGVQGGPADYGEELRALAGRLRLGDHVVFTGFRTDVPALLAMLDVAVHASVRPEPFGRVIAEAMAMGKPVVASSAGGPVEILADGRTGFLVAPGDDGALAERLVVLLRDRELRRRVGEAAGRDARDRFSVERHMRAIHEIYEAVFRSPRSTSRPAKIPVASASASDRQTLGGSRGGRA